jgi:predicted nucleic acid-binding protein
MRLMPPRRSGSNAMSAMRHGAALDDRRARPRCVGGDRADHGRAAGAGDRRCPQGHGGGGERLLVPDDFWLELVNVLVRRYRLPPERVVEAVQQLDDLGIASIRMDRSLILVALDLAAQTGVSAYDAAYLAVAQVEDTRLLSLDRELAAAAGPRAIRLPSDDGHRLSEPAAPYSGEPIDWARFGPYLARLRADADEAARR